MIDFSALKGLTIPEGVVIKIVSGGVVLWELSGDVASDVVSLEVEKIVANTYANSTTYNNEEFVLLSIYPKTNGTVSVTYGGLTKTVTDTSGAAEPNEQKVFFGTFNGVADSVETPASGTLTIEGDYRGWGIRSYNATKNAIRYCNCITEINNWGNVEIVPTNALHECSRITNGSIPDGVTKIGSSAFDNSYGITSVTIPASVTSINTNAFTFTEAGHTRIVTLLATTPPRLYVSGTFDAPGTHHFEVPAGCADAYKTAEYWSEYADYITEASE